MPFAAGVRLGSYEIVGPLGAGGMGEVYRARDTRLERDVALKVLPAELADRPEALARFEREAKAVAALSHPNILSIFDFGSERGVAYAVAELLEGETLRARLASAPLPLRKALDWAQQIAQGLAAAHEKGVVHRDLKPENVFVTHDGRLKILDFGLARREAPPPADDSPTLEQQTEPGTLLGTIGYMSPEQARGRPADARSDIFSFGALLYEMLTGRQPFLRASSAETLSAILKEDPPAASSLRPELPAALERIVVHCLEKSAADRFQSVRDLAFDLASVPGAAAAPPARRGGLPLRAMALGLLALVVAGLGIAGLLTRAGGASPQTVVLMDAPYPDRVYDDATRKAGGTNADDLTDVLRDLPVLLVKENTSVSWRREDEVLRQQPDLVVVHRSCFFDANLLGNPDLGPQVQPLAWDKLEAFVGYVGLSNPRTRFLVYSRRSWPQPSDAAQWVAGLEKRFPALRGRVEAWRVPQGRATFRDPQTGAEIRADVVRLLGLAPAESPASKASP